ncbi:HU domain-containing protein [Phocaeicola oris]|uniref:HU domain-containing protein n=1 Tax=Phocaeicola oris TaxID=2896850 RepID=UPI00234FAA13|nr:SPOR domain-containing protein [Phocaeicola oris]MCE2615461.1 SPOR domain-containing protein [Phocaeicola oris]
MNELIRHIEILLLENDCVIVPELGGFIAHYQSAYYDTTEHIYYPPKRTIGFNPKLTINDGLLVQFYMQTYHTDFPDATRKIKKEVEKLKDCLYKEGGVEIPHLGKLCCNIHGIYEFHSDKEEIVTPSLYAFNSFQVNALGKKAPIASKIIPLNVQKEKSAEKQQKVIPMRWLGDVVAVAAAIFLFFVLSTPLENTYVDDDSYASLSTDELFSALKSQSLALNVINPNYSSEAMKTHEKPKVVRTEPVSSSNTKTNSSNVQSNQESSAPINLTDKVTTEVSTSVRTAVEPVSEPAESTPAAIPVKKNNSYHIIIASLDSKSGAQHFIEAQKNLTELSIVEGDGHFRVSAGSFDNETAAYKRANELKQQGIYQSAWVLHTK